MSEVVVNIDQTVEDVTVNVTQNVDDISTKLRIMIRNKRLRRKMSKQSLRIYNDLV